MIILNYLHADEERAKVFSLLSECGVHVASIEELRYGSIAPGLWANILVTALPGMRDYRNVWNIVACLSAHVCPLGACRELIEYYRTFPSRSYDYALQSHFNDVMSARGLVRPVPQKEMADAKRLVETEWYLSYEPPRERFHWSAEEFVQPDNQFVGRCDFIRQVIENALVRQAREELFDEIAELLVNSRRGYTRSLLPEAVVKCDRNRSAVCNARQGRKMLK